MTGGHSRRWPRNGQSEPGSAPGGDRAGSRKSLFGAGIRESCLPGFSGMRAEVVKAREQGGGRAVRAERAGWVCGRGRGGCAGSGSVAAFRAGGYTPLRPFRPAVTLRRVAAARTWLDSMPCGTAAAPAGTAGPGDLQPPGRHVRAGDRPLFRSLRPIDGNPIPGWSFQSLDPHDGASPAWGLRPCEPAAVGRCRVVAGRGPDPT